jgi:hypothetical protein
MQDSTKHVGPWFSLPWQETLIPQKKIEMEKPHGGIGVN